MKPKLMSRARMEELGVKYGVPMLPADHPVFSEGPSIQFVRNTAGKDVQKDASQETDSSAVPQKK